MAKIIRRTWTTIGPTGKKVRHVAYGFRLMNGQRERKFSSAWLTEADAVEALAARQKAIGAGLVERPVDRTLGDLAEEYLGYKGDQGKRSLKDDERSQIRTAFEAALVRAGIAGFRFHDLRHTAASHLVMRGASLKDVQEILGHSDLRMTNRYAHLSPAHLRAAVDRLEGLTSTRPEMTETPSTASELAHKMAHSVPEHGSV
jgi:integrase